ncbi:MAG TPA: hypothetical protein VFF52_05970 [Isosphaeraceae bacterium]|nr:hypothetical protein [Isosphaeraceae bacterium]
MKVRAELHCYHCGYVAATVEGSLERPIETARLIQAPVGPGARIRPGDRPRCGRCGGPLYLAEIELVRPRHHVRANHPLPAGRHTRTPEAAARVPAA